MAVTGIDIDAEFNPQFYRALDKRTSVKTILDRNNITFKYEGIIVYVTDDKKYYKLIDSSWVIDGGNINLEDLLNTPATANDGDTLVFKASTGVWEAKTIVGGSHNRNEDNYLVSPVTQEANIKTLGTTILLKEANFFYRNITSGEYEGWALIEVTHTAVFLDTPTEIRPNDYVQTTNQRHWKKLVIGSPLYDGSDTTANILSKNATSNLGKTWWSLNDKIAYKSVTVNAVDIWQPIGIKYNEITDTYELPTSEDGQTLNLGQEVFIPCINKNGVVTGLNPKVFLAYENSLTYPEFENAKLAKSGDLANGIKYGINTTDAASNDKFKLVTYGRLNGVNTSAWTIGTKLYIDSSTAGNLTNIKPTDDIWFIGEVKIQHATTGVIFVNTIGAQKENNDVARPFFGFILDDVDGAITSNGVIVNVEIEKLGGGDLSFIFSDGIYTLDTTPILQIPLIVGTDTIPQINYVYLDQTDKTIKVSTSGFPITEHARGVTVLCQSAASVQTYGAYKVHFWIDHLDFHIQHVNEWIRKQPATWVSGVSLIPTGGLNTFDIAVSAGVVLQLHSHTFSAFDTSINSDVYVINDNTTAYNRVNDLFTIVNDANGNALQAYYTFIIWGVASESPDSKLMLNLPSSSYNNNNGDKALNDTENYNIYDIPTEYVGVGFLIAAITVSKSGATITIEQNIDLRGQFPNQSAGGGISGGTEFVDSVFKLLNNLDSTKTLQLSALNQATSTNRTIFGADRDIDLDKAAMIPIIDGAWTDFGDGSTAFDGTLTVVKTSKRIWKRNHSTDIINDVTFTNLVEGVEYEVWWKTPTNGLSPTVPLAAGTQVASGSAIILPNTTNQQHKWYVETRGGIIWITPEYDQN